VFRPRLPLGPSPTTFARFCRESRIVLALEITDPVPGFSAEFSTVSLKPSQVAISMSVKPR
jgi:hypothetical protein